MSRGEKSQDRPGQYAYDGLDRVIHEKARLGILASLAGHRDGLSFNDLKEVCSLTDGNLSRHLTVLADAGLVRARKGRQGTRQHTRYRLSAEGKRRFTAYIGLLDRIVSDASPRRRTEPGRGGSKPGLAPS